MDKQKFLKGFDLGVSKGSYSTYYILPFTHCNILMQKEKGSTENVIGMFFKNSRRAIYNDRHISINAGWLSAALPLIIFTASDITTAECIDYDANSILLDVDNTKWLIYNQPRFEDKINIITFGDFYNGTYNARSRGVITQISNNKIKTIKEAKLTFLHPYTQHHEIKLINKSILIETPDYKYEPVDIPMPLSVVSKTPSKDIINFINAIETISKYSALYGYSSKEYREDVVKLNEEEKTNSFAEWILNASHLIRKYDERIVRTKLELGDNSNIECVKESDGIRIKGKLIIPSTSQRITLDTWHHVVHTFE